MISMVGHVDLHRQRFRSCTKYLPARVCVFARFGVLEASFQPSLAVLLFFPGIEGKWQS